MTKKQLFINYVYDCIQKNDTSWFELLNKTKSLAKADALMAEFKANLQLKINSLNAEIGSTDTDTF